MLNKYQNVMTKLFKESLKNDNTVSQLIDSCEMVADTDSHFPDRKHEIDMSKHETKAENLRKYYIAGVYLYMKLTYRAFRKNNLPAWRENMIDLANIVGDKGIIRNIKNQIKENQEYPVKYDKLPF